MIFRFGIESSSFISQDKLPFSYQSKGEQPLKRGMKSLFYTRRITASSYYVHTSSKMLFSLGPIRNEFTLTQLSRERSLSESPRKWFIIAHSSHALYRIIQPITLPAQTQTARAPGLTQNARSDSCACASLCASAAERKNLRILRICRA